MTTPYPPELAAILARLDDDRRPQEAASDQAVRLIAADWLDERAGVVPCGRCEGRGVYRVPVSKDCPWCKGTGGPANSPCNWCHSTGKKTRLGHAPCPACYGSGVAADGHADYAAFLRLMAREGVVPFIALPEQWIWADATIEISASLPSAKARISRQFYDRLSGDCGGWFGSYPNYKTRDRAERALYAAWVAADRPATLRG